MRIAIFSDAFYPQVNGIVTSIVSIAEGMADKGHEVIIVAPEYEQLDREYTYNNVTVMRVPSIEASFYKEFRWSDPFHRKTYKKFKKLDVDVIHIMTPVTICLLGIFIAKKLNIPMIGTYHTFIAELTYLRQLFPYAGKATQKLAWRYTNSYYNRAKLVTTPTEYAREELIRNRCKADIIAVSNGVNLNTFDNSRAAEMKQKYNPDGEIILYVGRVSHEKNMDCLLDSFYLLTRKDESTKLLVIGDGPTFEASKAKCRDLGIKDRVIFTGAIPNEELKVSGIYGACRLFVTASLTETQSITVLEAEANGLPCVGPDAKGIPCVISDKVNGFVVPPNDRQALCDAMEKILSDDDLHRTFSKNSLKEVKKHDFQLILDEWEERYYTISKVVKPKKKELVFQ